MAEVVAPPTVLPRKLATKALVANPVSRYEKDASIPRNDYLSQHQLNDVRTLRAMNRIIEALRKLVEVDGTVSTAVFNLVQVANSDITLRAYDSTTHTFSQDGTMLAQSVVASFDTLFDYTLGYADKPSMGSLVETMLREATITGSVLIFLLGVGVFLEPKVLGGGKSPMSAELIRQTFETRVNWPLGAALTLVLMVVAIFVVLLFSRVAGMRRAGA